MSGEVKQNRYVAYFDMLGLKSATKRDPAIAWESLVSLRHSMDEISKLVVHVQDGDVLLKNRVKVFILADSVLLFTAEDSHYDLTAILLLTSELFAKCLSKCVPMRGAITHGELFYNFDLNLFAGRPFVRAYELEKAANWSGIVVDEVVAEKYQEKNLPRTLDGKPLIINYNVPLKDNMIEKMWVLDWVTPHINSFKTSLPVKVDNYYAVFANVFGPMHQLSEEVKQKYINTVAFINSILVRDNLVG
ncbi:MAG: hypothetical protein AB1650_04820 [Candidatus Omnitrophota bacterium]